MGKEEGEAASLLPPGGDTCPLSFYFLCPLTLAPSLHQASLFTGQP